MRKSIIVLGIVLLFVGVISLGISRTPVYSIPDFPIVAEVTAPNQTTYNLTLVGNLTRGDTFLIRFEPILPTSDQVSMDAGVEINLTDPEGRSVLYDIPLDFSSGQWFPTARLPEGVANITGAYKVKALGYMWVYLRSLTLKKAVEKPPQYPYDNLLPAGIAVVIGGTATSIFGAKSTKSRKNPKTRSSR